MKQQQKNSRLPADTLERIISRLTPLLRKSVEQLQPGEEQLLVLLTMITVASSLFTRIAGVYDSRKTYPNLFLFNLAPPASGKGLMEGARAAFGKIHDYLLRQSKTAQRAYKEQVALALKSKTAPPEKPPFAILFLPGNCTSSKMIDHLAQNGLNPMAMLETEASTVEGANKSQYGGFTDLLRKSFQGEAITYTRKFNDEFTEVREPKLAVAISGTPEQVVRLIGSAEDGTYSRYLVNYFNGTTGWKNVNSQSEFSFTDLLKSQQDDYFNLWRFFADRDVRFDFTPSQWDRLNEIFRAEEEAVEQSGNIYAKGIVRRHGLILFKMCAVLTAFRMFELNDTDALIECTDQDFEIAKELVFLSLDSSLEFLEQLPQPKLPGRAKDKKREFAEQLKESFTRADAVEIGLQFKVSARTVDRWLVSLITEGKLLQEVHGQYTRLS